MDVPDRPQKVTKAEAATRQVEAAIAALVLSDFDIAVTLAGAAEGMIERSGPHLFKFLLDHPKAEGVDKKKAWITAASSSSSRNPLLHTHENAAPSRLYRYGASSEMFLAIATSQRSPFASRRSLL
jgi:hypothetical protein